MQKQKNYVVDGNADLPFYNGVDYCIGTGRMGLALQKEYVEQLELVQSEIGFAHIRGHGLFCDDMAIYQEYADENGKIRAEYNFTYLDLVMDSYRSLGLRPFLELGFMPHKLASGEQTVFYWRGNVTPPKRYDAWCALVQSTLCHLMQRYGADEVVTWPVEVWNEPNLTTFWKDADMQEYFRLFETTFAAVKAVDTRFRVGGPAVCGGTDEVWIRAFMEFCAGKGIALDFVTRHHYTTKTPRREGHYGYAELQPPEEGFKNLQTSRAIVDDFAQYRGLPIHITEFNTSYIPNCPLHDTNLNAAYIAHQLSRLGDVAKSYSYWTFGDIFEENGVPFTPFHGGFGLVANGCIPKPTFWAFAFFKRLKGDCVHRSDDCVIVKAPDGSYRGVAWNLRMQEADAALALHFSLPADNEKDWCLITKTVDEATCNPLKVWHDMGEPSSLSAEQKALLKQSARPAVASRRLAQQDGRLELSLLLCPNAVVYFELTAAPLHSDRGYHFKQAARG